MAPEYHTNNLALPYSFGTLAAIQSLSRITSNSRHIPHQKKVQGIFLYHFSTSSSTPRLPYDFPQRPHQSKAYSILHQISALSCRCDFHQADSNPTTIWSGVDSHLAHTDNRVTGQWLIRASTGLSNQPAFQNGLVGTNINVSWHSTANGHDDR